MWGTNTAFSPAEANVQNMAQGFKPFKVATYAIIDAILQSMEPFCAVNNPIC